MDGNTRKDNVSHGLLVLVGLRWSPNLTSWEITLNPANRPSWENHLVMFFLTRL